MPEESKLDYESAKRVSHKGMVKVEKKDADTDTEIIGESPFKTRKEAGVSVHLPGLKMKDGQA